MVLQRVVKPKNQRVKRALQKREPKIVENDKHALFLKGGRTSETIAEALKDLYSLKKPLATMYKKKNIMRPFEDETSMEFFSQKCDASLFLFGSHSKKRPNNLVLGRLYDSHVLDMMELGIDKFTSIKQFQGNKCSMGTKPCLVFAGEAFDEDKEHRRLKSLLIDFFRGPVVPNIRLSGLEHIMMFTAAVGKVYLRSYKILLKKSGSRTPRVELDEMGPSLDLVIRRTKLASDDLFKRSMRVPKAAKVRKVKNITRDAFGTQHGQIHMQRQNYDKLQLRKLRALKRKTDTQTDTDTTEGASPKAVKSTDVEMTSD